MCNSFLKISVIVPIYNAEPYLEKCLNSIINQTYTNLEIILIDDGSKDNSYQICQTYALNDERIILMHQDNHGLVYTRRIGMREASGDYIAFVDADDYIDEDMFSSLFASISDSLPDMVAFGLEEVYEDRTVIKKNVFEPGIYNRERLQEEIWPSMLSCSSFYNFGMLPNLVCKLISKSFFANSFVEVSEVVTVGEDADFTFQLLIQAQTLEIVELAPYHYCKRDTSMMWKELKTEAIDMLKKDLEKAFTRFNVYNIMCQQLEDYITFVRLLKNPKSEAGVEKVFSKAKKIALYGAGGFGQALYSQYENNISIWADKRYTNYLKKGLMVISPEELIARQEDYDFVYIAILDLGLCERIKESLVKEGLKKEIVYFQK